MWRRSSCLLGVPRRHVRVMRSKSLFGRIGKAAVLRQPTGPLLGGDAHEAATELTQ